MNKLDVRLKLILKIQTQETNKMDEYVQIPWDSFTQPTYCCLPIFCPSILYILPKTIQ